MTPQSQQPGHVIVKFQQHVNRLEELCIKWKIVISPEKSETMLFQERNSIGHQINDGKIRLPMKNRSQVLGRTNKRQTLLREKCVENKV